MVVSLKTIRCENKFRWTSHLPEQTVHSEKELELDKTKLIRAGVNAPLSSPMLNKFGVLYIFVADKSHVKTHPVSLGSDTATKRMPLRLLLLLTHCKKKHWGPASVSHPPSCLLLCPFTVCLQKLPTARQHSPAAWHRINQLLLYPPTLTPRTPSLPPTPVLWGYCQWAWTWIWKRARLTKAENVLLVFSAASWCYCCGVCELTLTACTHFVHAGVSLQCPKGKGPHFKLHTRATVELVFGELLSIVILVSDSFNISYKRLPWTF